MSVQLTAVHQREDAKQVISRNNTAAKHDKGNEADDGDPTKKETETVEIEREDKLFTYDVFERPPIPMTVLFALQHMLMSLSRSLSTSLLIADILCARENEEFKARLLSTTMLLSGICTLLQNSIGVRLPLYQGPAATYVVPLLALQGLKAWACPGDTVGGIKLNETEIPSFEIKMERLMGSLMISGGIHMLVGLTGIAGFLLRFIGPVSVIPALTITALYIYRATVNFCKVQWGVSYLTLGTAVILTFYLRHVQTPIPMWSKKRGFHVTWFPAQKAFSVLLACVVGWSVSAIITSAGGFSNDPEAEDFYARTDSRLYIVDKTSWFIFPYPGQFGSPRFDTGAFVTFLLGTVGSIIDSIGDYYACAKVIDAPPPPPQAVNRGLAIEGMMSFFAGWSGASHATSTFGGNIGAIGFTRVASLQVFQMLGLLFILFGIIGKIGAVFVTIPYSVVGGMQMINFGVLIGVMLSNLQFIDLKSTRNLAIIGISMLISLMMPEWIRTTENPINTGVEKLDDTLEMLLANPLFIAMALACFLDNTIPGTKKERGMIAWQSELGLQKDEDMENSVQTLTEKEERRMKKMSVQLTTLHQVAEDKTEISINEISSLDDPEKTSNTETSSKQKKDEIVELEREDKLFTYDVFERPPIPMTVLFALQMLISLSRSMSTSLLVADILCARENEQFKARLLSTTMFLSGMCTVLQNTIGVRLPLYQGPSATYVVPLLALQGLKTWACPGDLVGGVKINGTEIPSFDVKIERLMGSLMIAGGIHMVVGLTGVAGLLLRFIGPVTVVPAITITALYIHRATVNFCKVQWGVAYLTLGTAVILTFYLRHVQTPIPKWSRKRGFHVKWFPAQKAFSVLLACVVGWSVSAIITSAGGFSNDPGADDFYARTDSRLYIVDKTDWFIFPYPGQFGSPRFDTGAFVTFLLGTVGSIIDSIGDYYACANVIEAPVPPPQAVNRGLAIEGMMSFFAGWSGASHATSTFCGNIGAIGFTRVASLQVFQMLGFLFIVFGVVGKIGAIFVTIPYSVIGGMQMINFGVVIGVMLSNLQFIDLKSTRNMAIIGISMLISLMMPEWIRTTENPIDTGVEKLDDTLEMLLANPLFIAMALACFLDNTIPGTKEERGMTAWQSELGLQTERTDNTDENLSEKQKLRMKNVKKTVYIIPYISRWTRHFPWIKYLPFCHGHTTE